MAVNRKQDRKNISYFFGILRNIQKEEDDQIYRDYCREKYGYQRMLADERWKQKKQSSKPTIDLIIEMALAAIGQPEKIQDIAKRKCSEWLTVIFCTLSCCAAMKKRVLVQVGEISSLTVVQKEKVWEWIAPLLRRECRTRKCYLDFVILFGFLLQRHNYRRMIIAVQSADLISE